MNDQQRIDWWTLTGIALCGAAAMAFSSWSQFETARAVGYPTTLAWVLPVTTDATALVATRAWLVSPRDSGLRRYAITLALACMVLSFLGTATHHIVGGMPDWIHRGINGMPALALAALVHLGALLAGQRRHARDNTVLPVQEDVQEEISDPDPVAETPTVTGSFPTADAPADAPGPPATPPRVVVEEAGASVVDLSERPRGKKAQMINWLDENAQVAGENVLHKETAEPINGATLDREFDGRNQGRAVLRAWRDRQASGQ